MTAEELLARVVRSEEASMLHWETCEECDGTPSCTEARELVRVTATAFLEAKRHVDASEQYVSAWTGTSR
jgi:hypothetical protein